MWPKNTKANIFESQIKQADFCKVPQLSIVKMSSQYIYAICYASGNAVPWLLQQQYWHDSRD
jgi:hypothetical protein